MVALLLLIAYLVGSVPFGPLLVKAEGIDLTKVGSGNTGATNVFRASSNWKIGAAVLFLDILKGVVPVLIAHTLSFSYWEIASVGLFAVIGHIFSIFLKFKGGKGVATTAGVLLLINPVGVAIALLVFIIVVFVSKYVSLASMLAAFAIFILQIIKGRPWSHGEAHVTALSLLVLCIIVYMHRKNILRLCDRTENKIKIFNKKG